MAVPAPRYILYTMYYIVCILHRRKELANTEDPTNGKAYYRRGAFGWTPLRASWAFQCSSFLGLLWLSGKIQTSIYLSVCLPTDYSRTRNGLGCSVAYCFTFLESGPRFPILFLLSPKGIYLFPRACLNSLERELPGKPVAYIYGLL